jgi:hypothetical protein
MFVSSLKFVAQVKEREVRWEESGGMIKQFKKTSKVVQGYLQRLPSR